MNLPITGPQQVSKLARGRNAKAVAIGAILSIGLAFLALNYFDRDDGTASPLVGYIGIDSDVLSTADGLFATDLSSVTERLIAECMTDAGHDYPTAQANAPQPGSRRWAEQYGFGVTTRMFPPTQVGEGVAGTPTDGNAGYDPTTTVDLVNDLDPDQRQDYLTALTGVEPADPAEDVVSQQLVPTGASAGCLGEAARSTDRAAALLAGFQPQIERLREAIASDQRTIEQYDQIAACVEQTGVTYVDQNDLFSLWAEDLQAINSELQPSEAGDIRPLSADGKARLLTMQAQEIELAVLTYDCADTPAIAAQLAAIRREYEENFLDEHRKELDAALDR